MRTAPPGRVRDAPGPRSARAAYASGPGFTAPAARTVTAAAAARCLRADIHA
ncbi:hypothetical protein ACFQ7J_12360 [Streptomyces sp. NPDC056501]|uniref:hypothetical protein n=1 Tax=Streptomyces sp. NPDC056501 TaxID=3345841 RepID=UPI0036C51446